LSNVFIAYGYLRPVFAQLERTGRGSDLPAALSNRGFTESLTAELGEDTDLQAAVMLLELGGKLTGPDEFVDDSVNDNNNASVSTSSLVVAGTKQRIPPEQVGAPALLDLDDPDVETLYPAVKPAQRDNVSDGTGALPKLIAQARAETSGSLQEILFSPRAQPQALQQQQQQQQTAAERARAGTQVRWIYYKYVRVNDLTFTLSYHGSPIDVSNLLFSSGAFVRSRSLMTIQQLVSSIESTFYKRLLWQCSQVFGRRSSTITDEFDRLTSVNQLESNLKAVLKLAAPAEKASLFEKFRKWLRRKNEQVDAAQGITDRSTDGLTLSESFSDLRDEIDQQEAKSSDTLDDLSGEGLMSIAKATLLFGSRTVVDEATAGIATAREPMWLKNATPSVSRRTKPVSTHQSTQDAESLYEQGNTPRDLEPVVSHSFSLSKPSSFSSTPPATPAISARQSHSDPEQE